MAEEVAMVTVKIGDNLSKVKEPEQMVKELKVVVKEMVNKCSKTWWKESFKVSEEPKVLEVDVVVDMELGVSKKPKLFLSHKKSNPEHQVRSFLSILR